MEVYSGGVLKGYIEVYTGIYRYVEVCIEHGVYVDVYILFYVYEMFC